jgi:hypothetical protein
MEWQQECDMRGILAAALFVLAAGGAWAQDLKITAGGDNLFGAKFGAPVDQVLPVLIEKLGEPTEDSGRIEGCPVNGIDERYVDWGGFGAQFYADQNGNLVFERWTYRIDAETGEGITGGPTPDQIVLPKGIRMGDPYTKAAEVWGFKAEVDEVFGIAWYFGRDVAIMTADERLDGPIVEIGVPTIGACE